MNPMERAAGASSRKLVACWTDRRAEEGLRGIRQTDRPALRRAVRESSLLALRHRIAGSFLPGEPYLVEVLRPSRHGEIQAYA